MKHFVFTIIAFLSLTLYSCSTTQTISVKGEPGNEIYLPNGTRIATIENSGEAKVKLSSDEYYAYLLSHRPGSEHYIPFALDYKHKNYYLTYAARAALVPAAFAAPIALTVAAIMGATGNDSGASTAAAVSLVGLGALGLDIVMILRAEQTQFQHKYKYMPTHNTNEDFKFTPIEDNGVKKHISSTSSEQSAEMADKNSSNGSNADNKTSVSKRKIKNKPLSFIGKYKGTGKLLLKNETIEEYNNIQIVIKETKNFAEVDVIESGESYFSSKNTYKVENRSDGYILTHKEIPSATIKIDKKGNIEYNHPKVNIENNIYTLKINGTKITK